MTRAEEKRDWRKGEMLSYHIFFNPLTKCASLCFRYISEEHQVLQGQAEEKMEMKEPCHEARKTLLLIDAAHFLCKFIE